jgi:hypothetical protein
MHDRDKTRETLAPDCERLRSLYARAFDEYGTRALWNMQRFDEPAPGDVLAMTRQLRIEGNLAARLLAEEIEKLVRAAASLRRATGEAEEFVAAMPSAAAGRLFLKDGVPVQPDPAHLENYIVHEPRRRGHWPADPGITTAMLEKLQQPI